MTHTFHLLDHRCVVTVRELEMASRERSEHFGCICCEELTEVVGVTVTDIAFLPEPDSATERLLVSAVMEELQEIYGSDCEVAL
jgi:hypothetical protein